MDEDPNGVETRDTILQVIREKQAIHKSMLCRRVGRAWGTVGYHLKHLHQADLIRTELKDGLLWAYPFELHDKDRDQARVLAEENAKKVYKAVKDNPDSTINELEKVIDIPIKVIRRHLNRMTEARLLEREGKRPQRFRALLSRWQKY